MDDGVIWEREKWIGHRCFSICRFDGDFGLGFRATLDDEPTSGSHYGFMVGPIWIGVCVFNDRPAA